jgi:hypothetical protein
VKESGQSNERRRYTGWIPGYQLSVQILAELANAGKFDDVILNKLNFVCLKFDVSFSEWRPLQGDLTTGQVAIKFDKVET